MLWAAVHFESLLSCQVEPTNVGQKKRCKRARRPHLNIGVLWGFPYFVTGCIKLDWLHPVDKPTFCGWSHGLGCAPCSVGPKPREEDCSLVCQHHDFFCATEAVDDRLSFLIKNKIGTPELAASAELRALTPFFKKPDTPLTFIGALSDLKCRAVGFAPQTPCFFKRPLPSKKKFRRRRCSNGTPPKTTC